MKCLLSGVITAAACRRRNTNLHVASAELLMNTEHTRRIVLSCMSKHFFLQSPGTDIVLLFLSVI